MKHAEKITIYLFTGQTTYLLSCSTDQKTIIGTRERFQTAATENNPAWSFNCGQKLPIVMNPTIKVEIPQRHIFLTVSAIFSSILSIQCDISVQKPRRSCCYKMSCFPKEQCWQEYVLQETLKERRESSPSVSRLLPLDLFLAFIMFVLYYYQVVTVLAVRLHNSSIHSAWACGNYLSLV